MVLPDTQAVFRKRFPLGSDWNRVVNQLPNGEVRVRESGTISRGMAGSERPPQRSLLQTESTGRLAEFAQVVAQGRETAKPRRDSPTGFCVNREAAKVRGWIYGSPEATLFVTLSKNRTSLSRASARTYTSSRPVRSGNRKQPSS